MQKHQKNNTLKQSTNIVSAGHEANMLISNMPPA